MKRRCPQSAGPRWRALAAAGLCLAVMTAVARSQATLPETTSERPAGPGVDPAVYARLLEENRSLRQRLETVSAREVTADTERINLMRDVAVLEKQVTDLNAELANLRAAVPAAAVQAENLRLQIEVAETERLRLAGDLERLREREQRLLARIEDGAGTESLPRIDAGSDLVRERDRENARLRGELEQLRGQSGAVTRQRDTALGLVEELMGRNRSSDAALELLRRQRDQALDLVEQLMARRRAEPPDLSARLRAELDQAIRQRDEAVSLMEEAMARRIPVAVEEPATIPRVAMATYGPSSMRAELLKPELRRQRDLRYNIGLLEMHAGRWNTAEREFMAALDLDPEDADIHYNLGVLYEQGFSDRRRAESHYRKFILMHPDSINADTVRLWLKTAPLER